MYFFFGDGAAAAVLVSGEFGGRGIAASSLGSDGAEPV